MHSQWKQMMFHHRCYFLSQVWNVSSVQLFVWIQFNQVIIVKILICYFTPSIVRHQNLLTVSKLYYKRFACHHHNNIRILHFLYRPCTRYKQESYFYQKASSWEACFFAVCSEALGPLWSNMIISVGPMDNKASLYTAGPRCRWIYQDWLCYPGASRTGLLNANKLLQTGIQHLNQLWIYCCLQISASVFGISAATTLIDFSDKTNPGLSSWRWV